jgi:CHRD domain/PEP-CTERM motif
MRLAAPLTAALLAAALPATAALTQYGATLTGARENPPNLSTATGSILVTVDDVADTMLVQTSFAGLVGGSASASHIHCCVAAPNNVGVAVGMPGFPASTSASYDHLFDMTDTAVYSAAFVTNFGGGTALGAFDALVANMNSGTAYFNIHNATYPGGEIRGFLTPVPEPQTYALMLAGLAGIALAARRRSA